MSFRSSRSFSYSGEQSGIYSHAGFRVLLNILICFINPLILKNFLKMQSCEAGLYVTALAVK